MRKFIDCEDIMKLKFTVLRGKSQANGNRPLGIVFEKSLDMQSYQNFKESVMMSKLNKNA